MKKINRILSVAAAAVMVLCLLPFDALAADNQLVLTTINFAGAVSSVNVSTGTSAVITVPYASDATVDLSNGLDITYSTTKYSSATASFLSGSIATVGGAAVDMTVSYQLTGDATIYTTVYKIQVVRAAYVAPTFTGTLSKSATLPETIAFDLTDFTSKYAKGDGESLAYISIQGSNPSSGSLKIGTADYSFGDLISAADLSSGKLTFQATDACTVSYTASAFVESAKTTAIGSGIVKITVKSAATAGTVTYSTTNDDPVKLSSTDFSSAFTASAGTTLSYVKFTLPLTSYGVLYYNYTSSSVYDSKVSATTKYYKSSSPYISYISFVPNSSYTGSVEIAYTAYDTSGSAFLGTLKITVTDSSATTVLYSTKEITKTVFDGNDFNSVFESQTGKELSYVKFVLPSTSYGKLYYNYTSSTSYDSAVSSTTKYYYSTTPSISKVAFVPAAGFTGTASISFTGYDSSGGSLSGKVKIEVLDNSDVAAIELETVEETKINLGSTAFNTLCKAETGYNLSYVKFTLPSSTYGKLYYNYTSETTYDSAVSASTKYYYSSTPYLSKVSFVPYTNYVGTVSIAYTGYDTQGTSYTGKVKITVTDDGYAQDITYTTSQATKITFSRTDFSEVCLNETGGTLSYVTFTLPSSSYGKLYYNYTSSSTYDSAVSASTKYYYGSSPYLYRVSFVPYSSFTGTAPVIYKAYDTDGNFYSGKILITVEDSGDVAYISYTTDNNNEITFDDTDFNDICTDTNNKTLDYVKFTLPSSSYGKLYYNYTSASDYDSAVSASTKYYYTSSPYLGKVTFVPDGSYSGTAYITYTAYDVNGGYYTGKVKITVTDDGSASYISYSGKSGDEITFDRTDFYDVCSDQTGGTLSYVKFTLPSSSYGKLYYSYTSASDYDSVVSSSTKYYYSSTPYLSRVSFVTSSSYSGTAYISYTAYDTTGEYFTGKVKVIIEKSSSGTADTLILETKSGAALAFDKEDFNDISENLTGNTLSYVLFTLPSASYGTLYYNYSSSSSSNSAVSSSTKYYYSAAPSINNISFVPAAGFSGNAAINYVAYDSAGDSYSGKITITVVNAGSQYFTDVGSAYFWAVTAIDNLYKKGVITGTGDSKFSPAANVKRCDFMLMLYRAFSLPASTTQNFSDVASGTYYYDAVASAKSLGIAEGYGGKFYPADPITRQDAMVLIMRVLNYKGITLSTGTAADLSAFTDNSQVADYAKTAVATLVKAKLVSGDAGRLNPLSYITRAEMTVLLNRVLSM